MEESCNRRYLIRKGLYELEVHDLCFLYEKYDFDNWECREQEELIVKMYDYICAKDHAFDTGQIQSKKDGQQLIFYNNSSYLLVDAPNVKEALDIFWDKHMEFREKIKAKERLEDN